MTRQEHLDWCKTRAMEYLDNGDIRNGIASMLSDMEKHPDTKLASGSMLNMLGLQVVMANDIIEAKRFVQGFN